MEDSETPPDILFCGHGYLITNTETGKCNKIGWDSVFHILPWLKVAFFQKVRCVFQISKSPKKYIPKNYPELEI